MKAITARDIDILARTIDGEAEGETTQAKIGVAYCVMRRAALASAYVATHSKPHPLYGDGSVAAACLATTFNRAGAKVWQFDCWIDGTADSRRIAAKTLDDPNFQNCYAATLDGLLGRVADPTNGATHYWDISIATPSWAQNKPFLSIGHLRFVNLG